VPSLRRIALAAAVLALLPATLLADTTVLPSSGKAVGVVRSSEPGKWIVLSADFTPVQPIVLDDGKACIFEGPAGRYAVFLIPPGESQPQISIVVLGGVSPVPPAPVPPGPTPPDPPSPTPPDPTPAGPRGIAIIRETAETSAPLARLINQLRTGPQSQYLASKGHKLDVWDDDSVLADGRPSPKAEAWKPIYAGLTLPVLIIYDPASKNILHKGTLPESADAVIEAVRKAGG
jgi:hypothetical protein